MNRRKLLGLGGLGAVAMAAPFMAAACAVMPRRIQDQVIDGALTVNACHNMTISNCTFLLKDKPEWGVIAHGSSAMRIVSTYGHT